MNNFDETVTQFEKTVTLFEKTDLIWKTMIQFVKPWPNLKNHDQKREKVCAYTARNLTKIVPMADFLSKSTPHLAYT